MAPSTAKLELFQPRTTNFADVRRTLRSEHGSAVESEEEISGMLATVDQDLDDCRDEIDRIQSEIHRLHSRTIFLENQRQRLERHKVRLRSLRSPFRKLPTEIALQIFTYVCDMNDLTSKKLLTIPTLNISGVCARWRDLLRSHPELWSCICICLEKGRNPCHLSLLDLYLQSSQQSPLTLEFTEKKLEILEPHHLAVCSALGRCSNRWKKLKVNGLPIYNALMSQNPTHFPVLEELWFHIWFTSTRLLDSFRNAPHLRSLYVWIRDVQSHTFPWNQLTQLNIAQCDKALEEVLERCPNIRELHVRIQRGSVFERRIPPITAAAVEKLVFVLWPCDNTADVLLESITCPSLNSLLLTSKSYKHPWPKDELRRFILRSSPCRVTTLCIGSVSLSDSDLIDLLHCIPDLLNLTVDDSNLSPGKSPITTHFVQTLHAFPSATLSSALVTKLQSISLTFSGSTFDDKKFVDMVSSRWYPEGFAGSEQGSSDSDGETACLRSVVMRFESRGVDEEIYRPLKHLEEAGMRAVVIGKDP